MWHVFFVFFISSCLLGTAFPARADSIPLERQIGELKQEMALMRAEHDRQIRFLQDKIESLEGQAAGSAAVGSAAYGLPVSKAAELPDISVVGNIIGIDGNDKNEDDLERIVVQEAEIALQGYLYPGIRADVIAAYDRHEGTYEAELEEAYVSFLETPVPDLSVRVGKKLTDFGKINPQHPHHWHYVDRPAVLESYFGGHGLTGQGANLSYLLPAPFFAQLDCGIWDIDSSSHSHGGNILGLAEEMQTARLWASHELSENQELEWGLSGVKGYGAHVDDHTDKVEIGGVDVTYRHLGTGYERWILQSEFLFLDREIPAGELERFGFYSFVNYRWDKNWDMGARYDYYESPFPGDATEAFLSGILTVSLTETTKLRLQYRRNLEDDCDAVFLQVLFGIGPHSHPLE